MLGCITLSKGSLRVQLNGRKVAYATYFMGSTEGVPSRCHRLVLIQRIS